jgi:hypothetical protein
MSANAVSDFTKFLEQSSLNPRWEEVRRRLAAAQFLLASNSSDIVCRSLLVWLACVTIR